MGLDVLGIICQHVNSQKEILGNDRPPDQWEGWEAVRTVRVVRKVKSRKKLLYDQVQLLMAVNFFREGIGSPHKNSIDILTNAFCEAWISENLRMEI